MTTIQESPHRDFYYPVQKKMKKYAFIPPSHRPKVKGEELKENKTSFVKHSNRYKACQNHELNAVVVIGVSEDHSQLAVLLKQHTKESIAVL